MVDAKRSFDAADGPMAINVHEGLTDSPYVEKCKEIERLALVYGASKSAAKRLSHQLHCPMYARDSGCICQGKCDESCR